MQKWKLNSDKGVSIFDKYLEYTQSKAIFNWQPITQSALHNVVLIHCTQLYEYNPISALLEYAYYVLTSKYLIKLKNDTDEISSGLMIPLLYPRFDYIFEAHKIIGFRLVSRSRQVSLYSKNELCIVEWKSKLSNIAIFKNFDRYFTLGKEIGKGKYAQVSIAICNDSQQEYAVKSIDKKKVMQNQRTFESLINEIDVLRELEHRSVVKLNFIYEGEDQIYIILEYLQGGELFEQIQNCTSFSEKDAIEIMRNILEAVAYIHSKGVIHRDIKPENILMM